MTAHKELHVYGPPGVGKTTYAAKQVQLAAEKLGPEAVMVASFTKTAAAEIGSRGLGLGEKQVGTLHSFAYRAIGGATVVEDFKGLKAWNAQQWRDDRRLSLGGNRGDDLEFAGESGKTEGDRLRSRYNLLRNRMTPRELWEGDVLGFARDWEDYKTQARGIDYTDMIEIALREGLVPGNYAAAFIDEAQDLSRLELSYVRFLGAGMDYFTLLGDPNQTLYHFKGATPNAFLDANLPKENVRVLGQSHRVPRAIHRRAAAWQLLPLEYKARDFEGEVKQSFVNCTDFELFDLPLKRQLGDGKTVMLLTSAAYMLTPILSELRAAAIPFHNPYRPTAAEWNPLLADKPHKPVHRLLNFFRSEPDFWGDAARTPTNEELWNAMQYLGKSAFRFGAKAVLEALARDRFRQKETADVGDLVAPGLTSGTLAERAERYAALQWDKLQDETFYLARVIRKYGPGVLKEKPQTIVGTIHSVKGGEAEIVYLFPELSPSALRAWYVDGEERDAIIRTYYVGLIRARESVFLCELHKDGVDFTEHHARAAVAG